jgi:glycerol kinase
MGAAYLAGIAVGYWKDAESIGKQWQIDRVFEPAMDAAERSRVRSIWHRAVNRSLDWELHG